MLERLAGWGWGGDRAAGRGFSAPLRRFIPTLTLMNTEHKPLPALLGEQEREWGK